MTLLCTNTLPVPIFPLPSAIIGSARLAQIMELDILARDIDDDANSSTRYVIIGIFHPSALAQHGEALGLGSFASAQIG